MTDPMHERLTHFREILRYVPRFRDRVFVIATDGAIVEDENFPNLLLDIRERQTCVLSEKTIVETQEQTLQLRYDRIFVVSRIADKSAAIRTTRQVNGTCIASAVYLLARQKRVGPLWSIVHIGLLVGAAAVNIVQVESRCTKICQRVWVIRLLEAAGWVECDVVIDELT